MAEGGASRRLAVIVAIDVAGYSRLMGADEEGTLSRLKLHRAATDPIGDWGGLLITRVLRLAGEYMSQIRGGIG